MDTPEKMAERLKAVSQMAATSSIRTKRAYEQRKAVTDIYLRMAEDRVPQHLRPDISSFALEYEYMLQAFKFDTRLLRDVLEVAEKMYPGIGRETVAAPVIVPPANLQELN